MIRNELGDGHKDSWRRHSGRQRGSWRPQQFSVKELVSIYLVFQQGRRRSSYITNTSVAPLQLVALQSPQVTLATAAVWGVGSGRKPQELKLGAKDGEVFMIGPDLGIAAPGIALVEIF